MKKFSQLLFLCFLASLAACTANGEPLAELATATLAPIVSMTPRFTATPVPSSTALPSNTPTPSDTPISPTPSDTPTPSSTPPITGIINSLQTVNVREGPGVNFSALKALVPGTGVQVLGQSEDGRWLNIKMDDGTQGWIANALVRINPTPTLIFTPTSTPNLTAMALGTPLPTDLFGGGTITPTPPRSVVTPTPVPEISSTPPGPTETFALPIIDVNSIQQTATALAAAQPVASDTPVPTVAANNDPTTTNDVSLDVTATFTPLALELDPQGASLRTADVYAYCDKPGTKKAPTNLKAGSAIRVVWGWFAKTPEFIRQHVDNAVYDVRVDGNALSEWKLFRDPNVQKQSAERYWTYWFVPYGPLQAGQHIISYKLTWNARISDGFESFGPGTSKLAETGTCTFNVTG